MEEEKKIPSLEELQAQLNALEDGLNQASIELQRREQGHMFTDVRPYSAKDMYGDKWFTEVEKFVDAEAIFEFSKKDQLKPIDIDLAGIYSDLPLSESVKKGKKITVIVKAGDTSYEGTHRVLAFDKQNIIIPVIKCGDATGAYQITGKVEAARNKVNSFEKRLSALSREIETLASPPKTSHQVKEEIHHVIADTMKEVEASNFTGKEQKHSYTPVIIGIVIAVGVTAVLYFVLSNKETQLQTA